MDGLLTIAELADIIGISGQAIYKRIKKGTIAEYVVLKDGKYFLKPSVIELYRQKSENPQTIQPAERVERVEQPAEAKVEKVEQPLSTAFLISQIESKDKLIAELRETIKAQQENILELSRKLTNIIESQNNLQQNFQILLAKQFDIKELSTPASRVEQPAEKVEQPAETEVEKVETKEPDPQQKKDGFLRRIFKKK